MPGYDGTGPSGAMGYGRQGGKGGFGRSGGGMGRGRCLRDGTGCGRGMNAAARGDGQAMAARLEAMERELAELRARLAGQEGA